jgi:DNA-binding response OmpR family regulator
VTKTILVVDDKANMRALLQDHLTAQGFRVVTAENGRVALYAARQEKPDLILLDLMMPEMDGYAFLTQFRRERDTPIIIITAKEEETDAVIGLELGADDYMIKPVRMRELVARVRAMFRRMAPSPQLDERLHIGDIILDQTSHEITVQGQRVDLTPTEFNLLAILMSEPGRVFSREILIDRLLDKGFTGLDRTINVHIRNLRAKVEPDPANPIYIETVFGIGYRFDADHTQIPKGTA